MQVSVNFHKPTSLYLAKLGEREVAPLGIIKVVVEDRIAKEDLLFRAVLAGVPVAATNEKVQVNDFVFC